uniref:OBG-type G domain-containing protein n=1 Tax=Ciona savignyi TaxID=51511 RepID=H2Y9K3_CIOSA
SSYRTLFVSCVDCKKKIRPRKAVISEKQLAKKFIDHKRILVSSGAGGDGRSFFLRDKNTEFGGPSGGDGGNGGDVIVVADRNVKSLENVRSHYKAPDGADGGRFNGTGKSRTSLLIKLPVGTYIRREDSADILVDLAKEGEMYTLCTGGVGGKGNSFFISSTNKTPEKCTPGTPGESMAVVAELRTLAHGGLVGFPNAGKSTILRSLTRARPAVGDYSFTTLRPHVGIMHFADFTQIAIADTPGIIEGAHKNKGLGIRFLRHIERCRFLLYIIDMSIPDPWMQLHHLKNEFQHYNISLTERPCVVVANKMDLHESSVIFPQFVTEAKKLSPDFDIFPVSGKNKNQLESLIVKIRELYDEDLLSDKMYGNTTPFVW